MQSKIHLKKKNLNRTAERDKISNKSSKDLSERTEKQSFCERRAQHDWANAPHI